MLVEISSVIRGDFIAFLERGVPIALHRDGVTYIQRGYEVSNAASGKVLRVSLDHDDLGPYYEVRFVNNPFYVTKVVPGTMVVLSAMN